MITRTIQAIAPDGKPREVTLHISQASEKTKGFSHVYLKISGLETEKRQIFGSDQWHAVMLAMKTARHVLLRLHLLGWKFIWEKDDPDYMDQELMPQDMYKNWTEHDEIA